MQTKLDKLRDRVTLAAQNPAFIHHKWFINWHLEIVETISLELCEAYPEANADIVRGLVWIHDYAKIVDYEREHDPDSSRHARDLLQELDFPIDYIEKLLNYLTVFESKLTVDLSQAALEVQIVSSADAASHMVGPFYSLFWYEHPEKTVAALLEANLRKLEKDWTHKITLPEVKRAFAGHRKFIELSSGKLPEKYL